MKQIARIIGGSFAGGAAFAQAAFSGSASGDYSSGVTMEDGGSDAGLVLLFAVGALLVIRALATPKPAEPAETPSDTTE